MGKSVPYLFQKRDVYHLQKRAPQQLVPTLGQTVIRKSLRTPCRATAIKTALKAASSILEALDREWHAALFTIPEGPYGCARTFHQLNDHNSWIKAFQLYRRAFTIGCGGFIIGQS